MNYQRRESTSLTPDPGAALDCALKNTLDTEFANVMKEAGISPNHFFLAGIAGFLARLMNQSAISALHEEKNISFMVDLNSPFRELLSQAALQDLDSKPAQSPDFRVRFDESSVETMRDAHCPLAFLVHSSSDETWEIVLTAHGWPETNAQRYLGYLTHFLESAALHPDQSTGTLQLESEDEALELYRDLNQTETILPQGTVLDLIAGKTAAFGNAEAVIFEEISVSYSDLDKQSTQLAAILRTRGADQTRPVAICVPRSEMIPALLIGALKAGSYFVPLDPTHPRQRLIDMLEECRPAVVLVSPETRKLFANTELPLLDVDMAAFQTPKYGAGASAASEPPSGPASSDKAYMIYTSGTTGRPKGVIVTHGSLLNLVVAMRDRPGLAPGIKMLAVATLSFDISVMDMLLPLSSGATLVIASERAARDPWELTRIFETQNITCMQATPVTWRMLLSAGYAGNADLKMIAGGEALSRDLANELCGIGKELWNCYGPTETTIYSSVLRIDKGDGPVTIGPPIANTAFYVADAAGHLLPPEFAGELYIGGSGVAAGYFDRPELNRDRFVMDEWTSLSQVDKSRQKAKLFRTGDQVRFAANGKNEFEFFGRLDHQVKLRGYRIELGEIEVVLRAHSSVVDAAVLLREDNPGEPWLVAYVTPARAADAKALLEFASRRLPQYMLPSRLVALQSLPLTGSGKVDKRALAALPAPADGSREAVAKATQIDTTLLDALEKSLLRIFRETLRLKSFGPDDNFFEYGGYSLLAIRLFARIGSVLHKQLPITALFDAPTVRRLAELVRSGDALEALVPIRASGTEAPFFLVHSYLLYGVAAKVVDGSRPVYGLRERSASHSSLDLQVCVSDYAAAIQRTWPSGPVHLGGWCAAANLTIELARKLMEKGRQVGMVALFDAEAPGFVSLPPEGSPLIARLKAMWSFHLGRVRGLSWLDRLVYVKERFTQAPLSFIEKFYMKYHARVEQWRRSLPWLPTVILYNRFTQIGVLQSDRIEALNARIQLFRARDVTVILGSDAALGWGEIGRKGVEVMYIPGHHESMFLEPNVEALRVAFQSSMRAVEAELTKETHLRLG